DGKPRNARSRKAEKRSSVFMGSSAPSRAGVEGCLLRRVARKKLQISPVSWLGGGGTRYLPTALRKSVAVFGELTFFSANRCDRSNCDRGDRLRLTVARRRRLAPVNCERSHRSVFPSTKSAVNRRGAGPLLVTRIHGKAAG